MKTPKAMALEKRIVQGLFVVVLLSFLFAEHARTLLDSNRAEATPTAGRATPGAAQSPVAFQR